MTLRLSSSSRQSSSNTKLLYDVPVTDGSIVQLFQINGEDHVKQLAKGINLKSTWKWMRNSVVFGTLSDSGVIQIWDLLTRRAIMRLEIEGASNCLWANFLIAPNGNPFLFLKDKFQLSFKELTAPTSRVLHMTPVDGLEHVIGFCTPKIHKKYLIYSNGSSGIATVGFSTHNYASSSEHNANGLMISKLLPSPTANHGMLIILTMITDWLVIIYEDGHIEIYDFKQGRITFKSDLKRYYDDEDDKSIIPMPMACDGRADLGRIAVAVAGSSPRIFILDISATNELFSVPIAPSIFNMDGCCDIAMYPDSRVDMIAASGLSGSVDVYKLSSLDHLENVPHREKVVTHLKFIVRPSTLPDRNEILLLCASDSNLSLWDLSECEDNPADCENAYDACLLDLPFVYNVLKADRVCIRRKTTLNRNPRLNQEAGDALGALSNQLQSLTLNSATTEDKRRKRCTAAYKLNKAAIKQAKHKTEKETRSASLNLTNERSDKETYLSEINPKLGVWMNGMKGTERKNETIEKWEKLRSPSNFDTKPIFQLADISKSLNIDKEKISRLGFFQDSDLVAKIRSTNYSHSIFPDLLKMIAFSFWQRAELNECLQYLVAAHGTFLKTDILDKHLGVMVTDEEKHEKSDTEDMKANKKTTQDKELRAKLYNEHMRDLKVFEDSSALDFQKKLNEINPDWTIIQITSLFHCHNRFHMDVVGHQETPAIFLTCFATPPGSRECGTFVTYIPEPVKNVAVSKSSLIDQFVQLMGENRQISTKNLERREYWETRGDHNRKMMTILAGMEENWLFPWGFLLGGNLVDNNLQNQIASTIRSIEIDVKRKLTCTQKLLLTKLMGNFNVLPQIVKNSIGHLICHMLDGLKLSLSKIAESVIKLGRSIPLAASRHPTILVLDQEIEQLPWEWITCMRSTSVTRMQSMPLLYASMKLVEQREPINPKKCFYVLNPDQSLANVQKRLKQYFASRKAWNGITGAIPPQKNVDEVLQNKDVYLYCGHGNGQSFYPDHALQKIICNAVPLLMGCASVQYKCTGSKSYSTSVLNAYMVALCPSVVGFLWEVTDVECDRVTVELLERWIPAPKGTQLPEMGGFDTKTERPRTACLATAVRASRSAATQFLTEAAIVIYGLPVSVQYTPEKTASACR